jgi:hypothetical protein
MSGLIQENGASRFAASPWSVETSRLSRRPVRDSRGNKKNNPSNLFFEIPQGAFIAVKKRRYPIQVLKLKQIFYIKT